MHQLFHLFEINAEVVSKILAEPNPPHRHEYEELIICTQGSMKHFIDFREEEVGAPVVCYVAMGKIHRVLPSPEMRGWSIRYKNELVPDSPLHFYSSFMDFTKIPLPQHACLSRYVTLCRMMQDEYVQASPDMNIIRHLLGALLAMIDTERKRELPIEEELKKSELISFNNFLRILEANFRRPESVQFYAGKMNMSERNLNLICRNIFQKSVSEIIETRKLIEAKQLLLNSEKSVSEIGYELGYSEKSYFTRVFHNKTGLTPTEFREQLKTLIS